MPPSPRQLAWRGRIEVVLALVAPALDLVLAAGDKLARTVERDEPEPDVALTPTPVQRRVEAGR